MVIDLQRSFVALLIAFAATAAFAQERAAHTANAVRFAAMFYLSFTRFRPPATQAAMPSPDSSTLARSRPLTAADGHTFRCARFWIEQPTGSDARRFSPPWSGRSIARAAWFTASTAVGSRVSTRGLPPTRSLPGNRGARHVASARRPLTNLSWVLVVALPVPFLPSVVMSKSSGAWRREEAHGSNLRGSRRGSSVPHSVASAPFQDGIGHEII
jgi:hypothetical protein